MKRFFATEIQGQEAILSDEELHHCLQVLRAKDGETVEIIDGSGHLWEAELQIVSKKQVFIPLKKVLTEETSNNAPCILAVALTKNIDRIEWLLEKATELGLKEFYPIITHRTERKQTRMDRLEKIIVSATKQSERLWKPILHEPIDFKDFLQKENQYSKYIGHCEDEESKTPFSDVYQKGQSAVVLIGPEGDFTEEEIRSALSKGYTPVSLGDARLRVETAALAACVWMNLR